MTRPRDAHVLILGAGMAGLGAARALTEAGVPCTVLEGRDRVGGRVHTVRPPGALPVELGAEFMHGPAPALAALCAQAGVAAVEVAGEMLTALKGRLARCDSRYEGMGQVFDRMDPHREPDRSFAEFLDTRPGGRRLARERAWARRFVEGFHAADTRDISERALASGANPEEEEDQRAGRVVGGYDQLPRFLAGALGAQLHLSTVVESVTWRPGAVEVAARAAGKAVRFRGRACIVTLPVGVLQARPPDPASLVIEPLPAAHARAISGLAMGAVTRLVFTFARPPLESVRLPSGVSPHEVTFLYADAAEVPVWWTPAPLRGAALVGWIGGPRGRRLGELPARELERRALDALARALGTSRRALARTVTGFHHHDWQSDPFARGAYAYPRPGHANAARALSRPVARTLWFAGEACAPGAAAATVHGAYESGQRAGRAAARAITG